MLDWVPAQLRVLRIRRPKYGCRACDTIHQVSAPDRPIAKGLATPGLIAPWSDPGAGQQVLRPLAALSTGPDLRPAWRADRTLDPGRLGRRRLLVAGAAAGAAWRLSMANWQLRRDWQRIEPATV
jgi:hypothetical protein